MGTGLRTERRKYCDVDGEEGGEGACSPMKMFSLGG